MTTHADMEEIKDSLMEVFSVMTDLTMKFNEMSPKELETTISNCLKYKVPPAFMISLYELGTQITSLRTLRWNLFMRNEKARETSVSPIVLTAAGDPTPLAMAATGDPTPSAPAPSSQADEEEAVSASKVNAYHVFIKEKRPEIAKTNPEMTPNDIMKELRRQWSALKTPSEPVPTIKKPKKGSESPPPESNKCVTEVVVTAVSTKIKDEPVPESPVPAEKPKKRGGKKSTDTKESTNELVSVVEDPEPVVAATAKKATTKKVETLTPLQEPVISTPAATKKTVSKKAAAAVVEEELSVSSHTSVSQTVKDDISYDSEDDSKSKKKKTIPKYIKTLVWNQFIGEHRAEAICSCCRKTQINVRHFHCGHVIAEAKGGDSTINNLRPICSNCNLAMGSTSMNEFAEKFFGWKMM